MIKVSPKLITCFISKTKVSQNFIWTYVFICGCLSNNISFFLSLAIISQSKVFHKKGLFNTLHTAYLEKTYFTLQKMHSSLYSQLTTSQRNLSSTTHDVSKLAVSTMKIVTQRQHEKAIQQTPDTAHKFEIRNALLL